MEHTKRRTTPRDETNERMDLYSDVSGDWYGDGFEDRGETALVGEGLGPVGRE
jgi:hypothetical protein